MSAEPPPPNPILTAYESFVSSTPWVTRFLLTSMVVSYFISWFINPYYALSNIPKFTLFRFEIYRIILSPWVNTSFFPVLFAFLVGFKDQGRRIEDSLGSVAYAWLCLLICCVANIGFVLICTIFSLIWGSSNWHLSSANGIWIIIFGLAALDASRAPPEQMVRLCFVMIPMKYYPVGLFLLFAVIGQGVSFALLIAMGFGYAYGYKIPQPIINWEKLELSHTRIQHLEETILLNLTRRRGWVSGQSATGMAVWNNPIRTNDDGGMTLPFLRPAVGSGDTDERTTPREPRVGSVFRTSRSTETSTGVSSSGAGVGRTLGGAATRRVDPRTARLQALEHKEREKQLDP